VMRAVGVKVLKNRLSECVRLAASGETVPVTAPLIVAEGPPPRLPVMTRDALSRAIDADRADR
jgi:hypothetical protein